MLYRNMLPRVGWIRAEILIINLSRSWEWRAPLRVRKVKKELILKNSVKGWALHGTSGGSLRDYIIQFLFHVGKLKFQSLCWWWHGGNEAQDPEWLRYNKAPNTLLCHCSVYRARSDGGISLVWSGIFGRVREESEKCYLVRYRSFGTMWTK